MSTQPSFLSKIVGSATRFWRERSPFTTAEDRKINREISIYQHLLDKYDATEKTRENERELAVKNHAEAMRAIHLKSVKASWKHAYAMQRMEARRVKKEQEIIERFWSGLEANPLTAPFAFVQKTYGRDAVYPLLQLVFGFERRWNEELLNASYSDDYSMRDRETQDVHQHQKKMTALFETVGGELKGLDQTEFLTRVRAFLSDHVSDVFSYMPTDENPATWSLRLEDRRTPLHTSKADWVDKSMARIEHTMLTQRVDSNLSLNSKTKRTFSDAL